MPPPDDAAIPDETKLFRRVPPDQVVPDKNDGKLRPSSVMFTHYEMSIVLEHKLVEDNRPVESALGPETDSFLAWLDAQFVRGEDQGVVSTPSTDPYLEPAHGDVIGEKKRPRSRRFARTAEWEIEPPPDFDAGR